MVVLVALLRIATSLLFWVSASSASRPVELLEKSLTAMGLDVSKLTTSRKRLGPKKNLSLTKCASMAQAKNWVFTLNAEEEAGEHTMWPLATQDQHPLGGWVEPGAEMGVKFLCYQVEVGEQGGHVHLQGCVCFAKAKRLATLKKFCKRAHWEVMRGTPKEAAAYCSKASTRLAGPFVHGDCPDGQGARHDVTAVFSLVKEHKTNLEILNITDGASAKLAKQIEYMRFTLMGGESDRQLQGVRVITLFGSTGTGKTYAAVNLIAQNTDYFILTAPSAKNSQLWFDGYQGQHILIIDDFNGDCIPFNYMLRLLDVYAMPVQIKGGFVWATWTLVVITTNTFPAAWYTSVNTAPLCRRLTQRGSEIRLVEHQGAYKLMDWGEQAPGDQLPFVAIPQLPVPAPAAPACPPSSIPRAPSCASSPASWNPLSPSAQPSLDGQSPTSTTVNGEEVVPFVPDHFPAARSPALDYFPGCAGDDTDTEEDLDLIAAADGENENDVMVPAGDRVPTPPCSPTQQL